MDERYKRFIQDNPNLSGSVIAEFLSISRHAVNRSRNSPLWKHDGKGLPFTYQSTTKDGVYLATMYKGFTLAKGKLPSAMENLDRLIYCLENNNGKLPPSLEEWTLKDLEFIND